VRVGWITYDAFPDRKTRFSQLDSFTSMRVGQVADWLNRHAAGFRHELYRRGRLYDVVVFQKMMNAQCQDEAAAIQARGAKVIFDANVNYYEVWGDYFIAGTEPTAEQQRDAIAMTRAADWVVADSTYLEGVISKITPRVTWIPDNVNLDVYGAVGRYEAVRPVRLVWSGVGKKAAHLLDIRDVLARLDGFELVLVTDTPPDCLAELERCLPCSVVCGFRDRSYAEILRGCDIIISPKRLVNAYEMAHTEYKIALGMAVGLSAVASPQQSYVEIIGVRNGGVIAASADEWYAALTTLGRDLAARQEMGARGRATVRERYSTPVVASQYHALLERLVAARPIAVSASDSQTIQP